MAGRNDGPSSTKIASPGIFDIIGDAVSGRVAEASGIERDELVDGVGPPRPPIPITPASNNTLGNEDVGKCGTFDIPCKVSNAVSGFFDKILSFFSSLLIKIGVIAIIVFVIFFFVRTAIIKNTEKLT